MARSVVLGWGRCDFMGPSVPRKSSKLRLRILAIIVFSSGFGGEALSTALWDLLIHLYLGAPAGRYGSADGGGHGEHAVLRNGGEV